MLGSRVNPQSTRRKSARVRVVLFSFLGFVVALCFFWHSVQSALLGWLLLRSEAPSEEVLQELAVSTPTFLQRLWTTGKVPHRQFVLQQIKDMLSAGQELGSGQVKIVLQSIRDPDCENRETALGILASQKSSYFAGAVLADLEDADPELRLFAMRYMRMLPSCAALSIKLLDDSDLRVVTTAASTFRTLTSQDFGLRLARVLQGEAQLRTDFADEELNAIRSAIQNTKNWWENHRQDYPQAAPSEAVPAFVPAGPVADFALIDLEGRRVHLSDFPDKPVLLNFWATWCTACLPDLATLDQFQKRHPEIVVLGIALDGLRHDHDDPEHAPAAKSKNEIEKITRTVRRVIEANPVTHKILLDPDGVLATRFNGGELPTNVLLDKRHSIRRRFVGARSIPVLEKMLSEI
jgi:thiol-disulfide isomerase/thioredoxin